MTHYAVDGPALRSYSLLVRWLSARRVARRTVFLENFGSRVSMAGKYLLRGAIIDTVKGEQRTNAIQNRNGLKKHPVRVTSCG